MAQEVIKTRLKHIRCIMRDRKITALLLTRSSNVTYTTGFMGEDSWALITGRQVYLITDSRYTEQAETECQRCRIVERSGSLAEKVGEIIARLQSVKTLTVENCASIGQFADLQKHVKARLSTASEVIEAVRVIKDEAEIAAIRNAGGIATKALMAVKKLIRAGMAESELAGLVDFEIRKLNSTNSFDTIVAFGPNASRPHHQPGRRKLKKRDTILIDFGATHKGYCSDITRCFAIGPASRLFSKVFDIVERAQAAAINAICDGVELTVVDEAARKVIEESAFPVYGHGTGHGLGLEIHENPFLKASGEGRLQAGQVITIEPGVYMPGKLGVRIEDDVLVTNKGAKILTSACSHWPQLPR